MNKKILTPLFVAASFLLIGCSTSEIISRPSWINESIISGDLKDNKLKDIYDAIKKLGDTNANVLNKVMYDIAQKHIGSYEELKELKDTTDVQKLDDFVKSHPIYESENEAYKLGEDGKAVKVDIKDNADEKRKISIGKIQAQYKRIEEDIYRKLHDEIKGGSYSTKIDKYFQEEYFIHHLYTEMYFDGDTTKLPSPLATNRVFIPKTKDQSWQEYVEAKDSPTDPTLNTGFIHLTKEDGEFYGCYKDYIDRKILPDIYRTLLIENYVREQRSTNLGRSYARKVNMITIPRDSSKTTSNNIAQMLINFANNAIVNPTGGIINTDYNLEFIKDAMVGFATTNDARETTITDSMKKTYQMLDNSGATGGLHFDRLKVHTVDGKEVDLVWKIRTNELGVAFEDIDEAAPKYVSTYVYRGTKLYDLADKYTKIMNITCAETTPTLHSQFSFKMKDNFTSDEQAAWDDLTNKGAYPVEKGVILKERELRQTDMTTDGWFLKNGGITDLNAEFRDKLFKITTSQIIDNEIDSTDEPGGNDTVRYFGSTTPDEKSGRLTNRKAFVFSKARTTDKAESIIFNDGSSSFHIVEVEEACSASKLAAEGANGSYAELHATKTLGESNNDMDEIIRKVTEQVANSDTYKKNAEQYYLMISNILFYDQSVYDYFKSQFPDLFK